MAKVIKITTIFQPNTVLCKHIGLFNIKFESKKFFKCLLNKINKTIFHLQYLLFTYFKKHKILHYTLLV